MIDDVQGYEAAIDDKTRVIFTESLANPGGLRHGHGRQFCQDPEQHAFPSWTNTMRRPTSADRWEHGSEYHRREPDKFIVVTGNSIGA